MSSGRYSRAIQPRGHGNLWGNEGDRLIAEGVLLRVSATKVLQIEVPADRKHENMNLTPDKPGNYNNRQQHTRGHAHTSRRKLNAPATENN